MIVSAIAAMDHKGLIGDGMKMPWRLPRDLRRFREHTLGKPMIMGRRTFESLRAPLEGRLNIVLTRNPTLEAEGCRIARSIGDALKIAEEYAGQIEGNEVMIIGGGVVFEETVPLWDRLLLTVVFGDFRGDTFFPLSRMKEARWRIADQECRRPDNKNDHPHSFLTLERQRTVSTHMQDFDLFVWLSDRSGPIAELPLTHY
jgi:dihydrofolate reductase